MVTLSNRAAGVVRRGLPSMHRIKDVGYRAGEGSFSLAARVSAGLAKCAPAIVAVGVLSVGAIASASETGGGSTDLGVDTDTMLSTAATDIGGYCAWGIGVAIAVIALWKVKKYAMKAG